MPAAVSLCSMYFYLVYPGAVDARRCQSGESLLALTKKHDVRINVVTSSCSDAGADGVMHTDDDCADRVRQ